MRFHVVKTKRVTMSLQVIMLQKYIYILVIDVALFLIIRLPITNVCHRNLFVITLDFEDEFSPVNVYKLNTYFFKKNDAILFSSYHIRFDIMSFLHHIFKQKLQDKQK